jgi:hypothetical protein
METKKRCDFCGREGEPFDTDPTYEWNYDLDNRPVAIDLEGIYQCACGKLTCMPCRNRFIEENRVALYGQEARDLVLRNMSQAETSTRFCCPTCLMKDSAEGDCNVPG